MNPIPIFVLAEMDYTGGCYWLDVSTSKAKLIERHKLEATPDTLERFVKSYNQDNDSSFLVFWSIDLID